MEKGIIAIIVFILERIFNYMKVKEADSKALIEWIRKVQKQPVGAVRLKDLALEAEEDILRQEKELQNGQSTTNS